MANETEAERAPGPLESLCRELGALWGVSSVCFFSRRTTAGGLPFPGADAYVVAKRAHTSLESVWNAAPGFEVVFLLGRASEVRSQSASDAFGALEVARRRGLPCLLVAPFPEAPLAGGPVPSSRESRLADLRAPSDAPWRALIGARELRVAVKPSGAPTFLYEGQRADAFDVFDQATLALCDAAVRAWEGEGADDVPATGAAALAPTPWDCRADVAAAQALALALGSARVDETSIASAALRLQAHELAGDCYLANLACRVPLGRADLPGAAHHLARVESRGVRFGAHVTFEDGRAAVLLASPERFVRTTHAGYLFAEPIKGTTPCSRPPRPEEAETLWSSVKETAELVLVTDLLRNDLNLVCEPGTVAVHEPFFLRDAGGLLQMQSTVFGLLRQSERPPAAFLPFLLPAGSVSGTPKKRVRELLAGIETEERGAYTGIVGLQCADGSFDSAVAIRSVFADARGVSVGIGAGITTLSEAAAEASEFTWKLDSVRRFWEGPP